MLRFCLEKVRRGIVRDEGRWVMDSCTVAWEKLDWDGEAILLGKKEDCVGRMDQQLRVGGREDQRERREKTTKIRVWQRTN